MTAKYETYPFRCTARQARRIQENLRYNFAANDLADAADRIIGEYSNEDISEYNIENLRAKLAHFRTIADE